MSRSTKVATKRRLGEILVDLGFVDEADLERALAAQREGGRRLGEVLLEEELVDPAQLLEALAVQFGLEFVTLDGLDVDLELVQRVPAHIAARHRAVPVSSDGREVVLAMANPVDVVAIDDFRNLLGMPIRAVLADPEAIAAVIERGSAADSLVQKVLRAAAEEVRPDAVSATDDVVSSEDAPVVRFVDLVLRKAIQERASDVHIEPSEAGLRIRFRIDGVLRDALEPPPSLQASLLARIKVMGGLDIAERRLPQDGRTSIELGDQTIDIRVATVPTVHGESAVLRLLRQQQELTELSGINLLPDQLEQVRQALASSWGMVLVTGPTGSGKTTTLYAALQQLNDPGRSIVAVEDPVEYRLDGLKQVQVNTKADLTFARALRSFLRADPDVILVGEVRDAETARIAVESSLTGHLVLSSLHTTDAASAPTRLVDMGVEPYLVTAAVRAVTAQRLIRRICTACAAPETLDAVRAEAIGFSSSQTRPDGSVEVVRGQGCARCGNTGYHGRFAIHEVMPFTNEIGDLVVSRAPVAEIRRAALAAGMRTMRQAGLERVLDGSTTPEQVLAVST